VYVVRHAERASTDRDSDLSPAGFARASTLDSVLADAGITRVVTTEFQRTRKTGAPAAARANLTPMVVATQRDLPAHIAEVVSAVRAAGANGVVLVVGHSNTVPRIVAALGGPALPDLCDAQYATLTVLRLDDGKPTRSARVNYGAADPADADACTRSMPTR
jgi:phosphohistidine phosphatase SixA